ncbi:Dual specificity phosphatase 29 [Labeo rohita]|uniref:Dual specificity phosphatase 29 n=1 Tax=Labeo rohita TaxID=84645 RepID=A0ABQ8KZU6_LABRO|nr:Dual specificity phosphatase 29 [Labeo rohita]
MSFSDKLSKNEFVLNVVLFVFSDKVLVHCRQGVSRSSTLFLAYLMIHHDMTVEDAIDRVIRERQIQPNIGFLNQLTLLDLNLVRQRKLQSRKEFNIENIAMLVPISESQVMLKKHIGCIMTHMMQLLQKCTLDWTPVTEVWSNVFIANEKTATDIVRLKEMGVTHILNAAAVKKCLKVLLGKPSKEDLLEKVNTGAKYYKGMNITYYGVPVMDDHLSDISKYFFPAAKFIHKALSKPENKVLLHCSDGVRRSPALFLAYLMIHRNLMLEDAIDCIIKMRRVRLNMGFVKQLTVLNSKLICQQKL